MSRLVAIVKAWGGRLRDGGLSASVRGPGHRAGDLSVSLKLTESGQILVHSFSPNTSTEAVKAALVALGLIEEAHLAGSRSKSTQMRGRDTLARAKPAYAALRPSAGYGEMAWRTRSRHSSLPIVDAYLAYRNIAEVIWSDAIGSHTGLRMSARDGQGSPRRHPCLLAQLTDQAARACGVQATFLFDPRDLSRKSRLIYGAMKGASIRLAPAGRTLLVAEGMETAASAAFLFGAPAWAALSAANLARFQAPYGVETLIIAADNDAAGRAAADQCERRHVRMGLNVELHIAPGDGADWNDVWRNKTRLSRAG